MVLSNRFACNQCASTFTLKRNLNRHLLTHGTAKQHKCDHCDFACDRKDTLGKHQKRKHPVAKLVVRVAPRSELGDFLRCSSCDYSTPVPSNLKRHIKNKHSVVPVVKLKCLKCEETFLNKDSLKRHVKGKKCKQGATLEEFNGHFQPAAPQQADQVQEELSELGSDDDWDGDLASIDEDASLPTMIHSTPYSLPMDPTEGMCSSSIALDRKD